jgi:flagellar hook-basal body complex protein FliE
MEISSILARIPAASTAGAAGSQIEGQKSLEGFGKALTEAISSLDKLQQEADAGSLQLAAGEPVELHDVMLAQERASLSFELAVQVRNKLVEAYQEIMRMQV